MSLLLICEQLNGQESAVASFCSSPSVIFSALLLVLSKNAIFFPDIRNRRPAFSVAGWEPVVVLAVAGLCAAVVAGAGGILAAAATDGSNNSSGTTEATAAAPPCADDSCAQVLCVSAFVEDEEGDEKVHDSLLRRERSFQKRRPPAQQQQQQLDQCSSAVVPFHRSLSCALYVSIVALTQIS